jgi:GMP synthase (glutamine-hydrolysing)
VRIPGEVTPERVAILQEAKIPLDEIRSAGLYARSPRRSRWSCRSRPWAMGDERTYENVVAIRRTTSDFMTADCSMPHDVLTPYRGGSSRRAASMAWCTT